MIVVQWPAAGRRAGRAAILFPAWFLRSSQMHTKGLNVPGLFPVINVGTGNNKQS